MAFYDRQIQHLLRRAGFGATPAEVEYYAGIGFHRAIDELIEFHRVPDDVDSKIDHGAASVMMAIGGSVRGGIYGTAPSLQPDPGNPTLENSGNDVHDETDFRSVYAKVIDGWLGGDSVGILNGDFRSGAPEII